jgi:hypothetical protein
MRREAQKAHKILFNLLAMYTSFCKLKCTSTAVLSKIQSPYELEIDSIGCLIIY